MKHGIVKLSLCLLVAFCLCSSVGASEATYYVTTEELNERKNINEQQRLMLREASTQLEAQKVQLDDLKKSLEKSKGNASIKYLYVLAGIVAGYYFAR